MDHNIEILIYILKGSRSPDVVEMKMKRNCLGKKPNKRIRVSKFILRHVRKY